jgi:hypothetical protein
VAIVASLGLGDDGPVVRHRADPAHGEVLRRTGARLAQAAHPGVVVVRASRPTDDGGWELTTAHAGHPVAPSRGTGPAWLAEVGASAAATLADLHDRGIVHGRLRAEHVLVGSDGSVVLSGLGPDAAGGRPADDVAALGVVLEGLAAAAEAVGGIAPAALEGMRAVARGARAEPATRRPSARRLAAELAALAPADRGRSRHPGRTRLVVAGAAGTVLLLAVIWLVALGGPGPTEGDGGLSAAEVAPSTTATVPAEAPCAARARAAMTVAACGHDVTVQGGAVIVDGERSVVAEAGDEVVVADWGCAGRPRAAVLRPVTGEVLVLSTAGGTGGPVVDVAARVREATALVAGTDEDGCARLLVRRLGGDVVPVVDGSSEPGAAQGRG